MRSKGAVRLFICYRRDDTLDFAGRLHDRLAAHFGAANLVLDIENVPIGVDFRQYLDGQIKHCDLFLALIGKFWLGASDGKGGRRIDDPHDFVRIEIESALARKLHVVPVLVGGAEMLREQDLPASIVSLAYINAAEIASNRDFNAHVDRLVGGIKALMAGNVREPAPAQTPVPEKTAGEQLIDDLKRRMQTLRPDADWVWKYASGWWSAREAGSRRIVLSAKPSRNLVRIRIRKNTARPTPAGITLAWDGWIAQGPESAVRNKQQLAKVFKQIKTEWA
jgi:hypothetical protein